MRTRLQLLSTRYNQPQLRPHHSLDACHQDPALLLFNLEPLGLFPFSFALQDKLGLSSNLFLGCDKDTSLPCCHLWHQVLCCHWIPWRYITLLGNSWVFSWAGTSVLVTGNLYFRPTAGQAVYCWVIVSIDFGSRLYNCLLVSLSLLVVATHVSVLYFLNYCSFLSYFLFPNVPYCNQVFTQIGVDK